MRHLDDVQLLQRVLARDAAAWREMVQRFDGLLRKALSRVMPDDVDDLLGDLWIAVLNDDMRRLRAWDPARGARLGSWLFLLATNVALDARRRRRARSDMPPPPASEAQEATALDGIIDREDRAEANRRAERLPRSQRQVLDLLVKGLDPDAVAAQLGWSVNTVYATKSKLIERMKRAA